MTVAAGPGPARTPARRKARQLAKYLRAERPDYAYLKEVFRHLRKELGVEVTRAPKKLPYVPTEAEISAFYQAVWKARRAGDVVLIKTLLYTGVRVAELVRIRIADVDLDACRIRINQGKGSKDRVVPFPAAFKETLALHIDAQRRAGAAFLFESSWKKPYSERGVRKILARYTQAAGITASISPHTLRHFLFTWLKMGRIASGASFGRSGEHALPAVQRAALRCPRPARTLRGCDDLGLHGPPGTDATMMRLMPLHGVHYPYACWHPDASRNSRLHRVHHRPSGERCPAGAHSCEERAGPPHHRSRHAPDLATSRPRCT